MSRAPGESQPPLDVPCLRRLRGTTAAPRCGTARPRARQRRGSAPRRGRHAAASRSSSRRGTPSPGRPPRAAGRPRPRARRRLVLPRRGASTCPSFHEQNASRTSNVTSPSAAYERSAERGRHVDEPHPERVARGRVQPPRLGDGQEQRMVGRQVPRLDGLDQVDAEQEAPDLAGRLRRGADRLAHLERARRDEALPLAVAAVQRVGLRLAVARPPTRRGTTALRPGANAPGRRAGTRSTSCRGAPACRACAPARARRSSAPASGPHRRRRAGRGRPARRARGTASGPGRPRSRPRSSPGRTRSARRSSPRWPTAPRPARRARARGRAGGASSA